MEHTRGDVPLIDHHAFGASTGGARQQMQQDDRSSTIGLIASMLDYAMIGGAELKLPWLVLLLRAARHELLNGTSADPAGLPNEDAKRAADILPPYTG